MLDAKQPTHYLKREGHEVPSMWLSFVSVWAGMGKGDVPRKGVRVPFVHQLALLCKSCVH